MTSEMDAKSEECRYTPFLIGVTGHETMLPDDEKSLEELRNRFRVFYRWLRSDRRESFERSGEELGEGLGLKITPIHLLTSLAPGVDQIAAQVAREEEFTIRVVAPLPFPLEGEQYLRSSAFKSATKTEKENVGTLPHESFYVELAEERKMGKTLAHEKREECLTDDNAENWQQAHYRAAGEYVAAYADLLLAVTDLSEENEGDEKREPSSFDPGHRYDCGAPAIVRVRRHGLTPGLLSVEPALPWAEAGPLVHLPWKKGETAENPRFSFSVEPRPDPSEVEAEREVIQEIAELVEQFNRGAERSFAKAEDERRKKWQDARQKNCPDLPFLPAAEFEMRSMLGLGLCDPEPEMPPDLREDLLGIAGARYFAKNYNYDRVKEVDRLRDGFLRVGFVVAILLTVWSNWKTAGEPSVWVEPLRSLAFVAALGLGGWCLTNLFRFRRERVEEDQLDSRCVAEGLRVQFYWTAAGTGVSVASNYLLRQRGAIRWITNAISAASFPYEPSRDFFAGMPIRQRVGLLGAAVEGWIKAGNKKGQIDFYQSDCEKIRREKVHYRLQGWTFLLAGMVPALGMFGRQAGILPPFSEVAPVWESLSNGFGLTLILVGASGLAMMGWWLRDWRPGPSSWMLVPDEDSTLGDWLRQESLMPPTPFRERISLVVLLAAATGLATAVLVLALMVVAGTLTLEGAWVPTGSSLLILVKATFFALSARAFLQSKLRFHTENLRNYEAMLDLFRSGKNHLDVHLARLEEPGQGRDDPAVSEAKAERSIQAIQDLFLALGREALSEHAEWLHLRRDRPVSHHLPNP